MNYPPYDPAPFLKKQKEMSGQAEARRRYDAFRETNSASFASLFRAFAEFYDPECKCIRCECYRLWNNLPLLRCPLAPTPAVAHTAPPGCRSESFRKSAYLSESADADVFRSQR